ncbi:MAG: SUMF1/EgtB/PvdO family nonheme iron enzyme [Bacteriovoracaceae bacterium]|nr:SUMF1/EgtB/PvdO family nonheme iron enzyme [Bacteriovoracaceae bacterium]
MKIFLPIICLFAFHACKVTKNLPDYIMYKDGKYISKIDAMELIYIPAGNFKMGSNSGNPDEKPQHQVHLNAYFIDKFEVSNLQFEKFVKATKYKPRGPWRRGYKDSSMQNNPVVFVTWHDAINYSKWAKRDLPTEAQWEYAARGKSNYKYPWGDEWNEKNLPLEKLVPHNTFKESKSPFGAHLLAGNVWEWVSDWYDRHYYQGIVGKKIIDPKGPVDGAPPEKRFIETNTAAGNERSTLKVIKGGSSFGALAKENARSSKRMWGNPKYWFHDTGFRCGFSLNASL